MFYSSSSSFPKLHLSYTRQINELYLKALLLFTPDILRAYSLHIQRYELKANSLLATDNVNWHIVTNFINYYSQLIEINSLISLINYLRIYI